MRRESEDLTRRKSPDPNHRVETESDSGSSMTVPLTTRHGMKMSDAGGSRHIRPGAHSQARSAVLLRLPFLVHHWRMLETSVDELRPGIRCASFSS